MAKVASSQTFMIVESGHKKLTPNILNAGCSLRTVSLISFNLPSKYFLSINLRLLFFLLLTTLLESIFKRLLTGSPPHTSQQSIPLFVSSTTPPMLVSSVIRLQFLSLIKDSISGQE